MLSSARTHTMSLTHRYLKDLQNYKLLSREEEKELSRRYRNENDQTALQRLVTGNLRLVVKIAKTHAKMGDDPLLDLIQEGNMGLIKAARRYDPSKQTKFSYYAAYWIKAYIKKFQMDNCRSVRIGTTQSQRKLFFNLRKTSQQLSQMGIEPTAEAIARELNVGTKDVLEMKARLERPDLSLSTPLKRSEQGEQVDWIRSEAPPVDKKFEQCQFNSLVRKNTLKFKAKYLDGREKVILERRLLSPQPDTLQTLGTQFGVSRERIRQVEKKIIEKLRVYLFEQMPDTKQFDTHPKTPTLSPPAPAPALV